MFCNNCRTPTEQYKSIGTTEWSDVEYITRRIEICPQCAKKFIEVYYTCEIPHEKIKPQFFLEEYL